MCHKRFVSFYNLSHSEIPEMWDCTADLIADRLTLIEMLVGVYKQSVCVCHTQLSLRRMHRCVRLSSHGPAKTFEDFSTSSWFNDFLK